MHETTGHILTVFMGFFAIMNPIANTPRIPWSDSKRFNCNQKAHCLQGIDNHLYPDRRFYPAGQADFQFVWNYLAGIPDNRRYPGIHDRSANAARAAIKDT